MAEQRDNSGVLFKNDNKSTDNHPDYRGSGLIAGREVWISGWAKVGRSGAKFLSLSFTPKQAAAEPERRPDTRPPQRPANTVARPSMKDALDDEIPF